MSRRVVIPVVAIMALVSVALLVVAPLLTSAGRPTALVTFAGLTNAVFQWNGTSETSATFRLTNGTAQRIAYYAESIETWTPGGCRTTTLHCTPTNWYRFGTTLATGEERIFHVPPPAAERWRIHVTCCEKAKGLQGIKDRFADYRDNMRQGRGGARGERFNGFNYQIVSPEVTQ